MDTGRILAELRSEGERIDRAIAAIEAISADGTKPQRQSSSTTAPRRRYRMSAAARRKMSAMMKARWAAKKRAAKP